MTATMPLVEAGVEELVDRRVGAGEECGERGRRPEQDREAEGEEGVLLRPGDRTELGQLLLHVLLDAFDLPDLRLVEKEEDDGEDDEHRHADRQGDRHPLPEGDLLPVASSMRPRPMRFGGDPTGVSRPPTLAP